ncbi:MAG: hypothetical protein PHC61_09535, partial [Chitinivibrionales bacterium]|nr:hypothetical protein [Chitinivibrionales bacterium]
LRGRIFIITAICLIVAVIFIRNNRDILLHHARSASAEKQSPLSVSSAANPADGFAVAPESAPRADTQGPPEVPAQMRPVAQTAAAAQSLEGEEPRESQASVDPSAAPSLQQSIKLESIGCTIQGRKDLRVFIALELFFTGDSARQEILLKREDLKIIVKQVVAAKSLDDMIVESLRPQLKTALNRLVTHAAIADLEFRDFRIEKVD